jgi:Icc-related predicted phosphoesterase
MKISIVSDLHSEFGSDLVLPGGDVLLLAGDVVVVKGLVSAGMGQHYEKHKNNGKNHIFHELMKNEFSKYKKVYAIAGNHEYYGSDIIDVPLMLKEATQEYPFFQLLEDDVVDLAPGWKLFAATMWTDYNYGDEKAMHAAARGMNDHYYISMGGYRFTPDNAYKINERSRTNLMRALETYDENFVIMTHHTPSMASSAPKWGKEKNLLNYAFCNMDLLEPTVDTYPKVKYWVHGHTHDSFDYQYNGCRVICNPHGYRHENMDDFDANKQFEV